jgi:type IV secretion system protein VirD4
MKKPLIFLCALLFGCFIAANVFAWENGYAFLPGGPFLRFSRYVVYSPFAYIRWLSRWLTTYPAVFKVSAMAGMLGCVSSLALLIRPSPPPKKEPAVWATLQVLRKAKHVRKNGFRLGTCDGHIIRHAAPGHIFILASTQSGKTRGLLIPSLLDGFDGEEKVSVIVHDPKDPGEIYEDTAGYRSTFSKVVKFDPLSPTSQQYDPLRAVRKGSDYEIRDLQIIADMLGDPNGSISKSTNEGSVHFSQLASAFNRGVLAFALYEWPGCHMEDVYEAMCGGSIEALVEKMKQSRHVHGEIHPIIASAVQTYELTADRELSAFRNTAQRAFMLWADPLVCRATSGSDFTLQDLREGEQPLSLYLSFPFADQERLQPLSRLMMRQMLEYAAARKDRKGEKRFPLFALIDEFQALGHLPILRLGLNYFLGMGVTMCLITPSMHEIIHIWGEHHPFLEGTATKAVFGIRDERIAQRFTGPLGTHPVPRTRTSTSENRTTTSTEDHEQALFSAEELLDLDENKLLVKLNNKKVILDKTPFEKDKKLLARSKMEVRK